MTLGSGRPNRTSTRRGWQREELLLAFNLYCKIPFGRMHRNNSDIIELASLIQRTPSAVAMKLVNFASLDPVHQQRKVSGLRNASHSDKEIFDEFQSNWEALAFESEYAKAERVAKSQLANSTHQPIPAGITAPDMPTERTQTVRVRTVQGFFRSAVLASYEHHCAMCEISVTSLLNASHIIPWSNEVKRRADPTNGIALCALHDRAFDRGLMTLDAELRIVISSSLQITTSSEVHRIAFREIEGKSLSLPHRFQPDPAALEYHRTNVFAA